jgi:hypothetical protein
VTQQDKCFVTPLRTGVAHVLNRFALGGFAGDQHFYIIATQSADLLLQARGPGQDGSVRNREIRISDECTCRNRDSKMFSGAAPNIP